MKGEYMEPIILEQRPGESKTDYAYRWIRTSLLNQHSSAGDTLMEAALCKEMNISRTPVKAAMTRLEKEGLLESIPGEKGMRIMHIRYSDLVDAVEIRIALEPVIAELAAERMTDYELEDLRAIVEKHAAAVQVKDWGEALFWDEHFHNSVMHYGKNSTAEGIYEKISHKSACSAFIYVYKDHADYAVEMHKKTYEAFARRDGKLAAELQRIHLVYLSDIIKKDAIEHFYIL